MSKDKRVTIRLSDEQYFLYEMKAASKGMKISSYIQSLLDDDRKTNQTLDIVNSLKAVEESNNSIINLFKELKLNSNLHSDNSTDNISMEILLMLRSIAKPEQMKMAHARMREKNIEILNLEDY